MNLDIPIGDLSMNIEKSIGGLERLGRCSRHWIGPKGPKTPLHETAELETVFQELKESLLAIFLQHANFH